MKSEFNILVAEDNADDKYLLQQAFKRTGGSVRLYFVADGAEVLAYLKGEETYQDRREHPFPDLLVLDLNLPRLNGFEVLKWVRNDAKCRELIVYFLTASCRDEDIGRAYELHINAFVMKPSRLTELVELAAALQNWHRFVVPPEIATHTAASP